MMWKPAEVSTTPETSPGLQGEARPSRRRDRWSRGRRAAAPRPCRGSPVSSENSFASEARDSPCLMRASRPSARARRPATCWGALVGLHAQEDVAHPQLVEAELARVAVVVGLGLLVGDRLDLRGLVLGEARQGGLHPHLGAEGGGIEALALQGVLPVLLVGMLEARLVVGLLDRRVVVLRPRATASWKSSSRPM